MRPGAWRSIIALAPLCVVLNACSPNDMGEVANAASPVTHDVHLDAPPHRGTYELPVHHDSLRIGDTPKQITALQPKNATELLEQSPLTGERYKVIGWHADQETVAAIMLDDEMVLGLITIDKANQDLYNETYRSLKQAYGEAPVPSDPTISYRFWETPTEKPTERLMLVYTPTAKGSNSMTIAVGMPAAMDALGMSQQASMADIRHARALLGSSPVETPR